MNKNQLKQVMNCIESFITFYILAISCLRMNLRSTRHPHQDIVHVYLQCMFELLVDVYSQCNNRITYDVLNCLIITLECILITVKLK